MKNIALIAGLSLVLSTTALADNNGWMKSSLALVYSNGQIQPATELSYSIGDLTADTLITADGTILVSGRQTKVTGPDLTTWGWSYYYDFKSRDSAIVVTKPIFTATNLMGVRNLNMEIEGFGGVGLNGGKLIGGIAGIFRGKVADQVWLGVGPGVTTEAGKPLGFGVLGQIQVKF